MKWAKVIESLVGLHNERGAAVAGRGATPVSEEVMEDVSPSHLVVEGERLEVERVGRWLYDNRKVKPDFLWSVTEEGKTRVGLGRLKGVG